MDVGWLEPHVAEVIVAACDEILAGKLHDQFVVDDFQAGAGTSFNMNMNEVIANRALELVRKEKGDYSGIHPNDHVNMAQSTNDTYPTALKLAAKALGKNTVVTSNAGCLGTAGNFPQTPFATREEREAFVRDWEHVPDDRFKQWFLDWELRGEKSIPHYPAIDATCEIVHWQEMMHYIDDSTGMCAGLSSFPASIVMTLRTRK